jgi:phosphatidylinositol glycan class K
LWCEIKAMTVLPVVISLLLLLSVTSSSSTEDDNTFAVIVSTSKFWYNYRHTANALGEPASRAWTIANRSVSP